MRSLSNVRSAARTLALTGTLSVLTVASIQAQDLTGRWRIEVRTGIGVRVNSGTSTSASGVETKTDAAGFLGAVALSRWFSEDVAGVASVGVLSVGTESRAGAGGVETSTAVVIPLFIGARRYLTTSDSGSGTRLFGSVEIGPVMGHESSSSVGQAIVTEAITRTALGGRAGVGVEFRLGDRVTLGVVGGYALMTDFSVPIGGEKNHSGADFGLSLGILLGG